jgi:hypothetical protein
MTGINLSHVELAAPSLLDRAFDKAFGNHRRHAVPAIGGARVWRPEKEMWEDFESRNKRECNFYFSPAVVKRDHTRTTKDDMDYSEWLWADLDPRDGQPLEAERAAMLDLLTFSLPIDVAPPTFIVDSGRGLWAFWRIKRHQFDGRDGDATRAFEAVLRGLGQSLAPYADRSVKNINRIARLPGTKNKKTGALAKIISLESATANSYTLADFPRVVVKRKTRIASDDAVVLDLFKRMLAATKYVGGPAGLDDRHEHDGWLNFAMQCHEAAAGDCADYLEAFTVWCQADPHAKETWTADSIRSRWESFDCDADGGATRGSWFMLLDHLGHSALTDEAKGADDLQAFKDDPPPPEMPVTSKVKKERADYATSRARWIADTTLPPLLKVKP